MEGVDQTAMKIEEIGTLLGRIKAVQRQTRWLRLGFVLLALTIIVGFTWSMIDHASKFDVEKFGQEIAKKGEKTWPVVADELNRLVDGIIPAAEAALTKEIEKAAPQIEERFNIEARTLQDNVKGSIQASMKKFLAPDRRGGAIETLKAAYPEFQSPEAADRLATSLQEAFLLQTQQRLTSILTGYYDAILKYESAMMKLQAGAPAGARPATLETVLEMWIELMYEKMGGDAPAEEPAKGDGKKAPKKG